MTVRMGDFEDDNYAFGRSYLSMGPWQGQNESYRTGSFRSAEGLVDVYEQIGGRYPMVSMRFIHKGRDYMRRWHTTWGDKTIARLAREFVEDVVG